MFGSGTTPHRNGPVLEYLVFRDLLVESRPLDKRTEATCLAESLRGTCWCDSGSVFVEPDLSEWVCAVVERVFWK